MSQTHSRNLFCLAITPIIITGCFLLWFVASNPAVKNLVLALTIMVLQAFVAIILFRKISAASVSQKPSSIKAIKEPASLADNALSSSKQDLTATADFRSQSPHQIISDLVGQPLSSMIGFVNLLSEPVSTGSNRKADQQSSYPQHTQAEILDAITSAASQIALLCREIIGYEYQKTANERFDIHQVIDDAISLLGPLLQKRGVTLIPTFDQTCRLQIEAQYDRTCILIFNMLLNYLLTGQYKDDQSIEVKVTFSDKNTLDVTILDVTIRNGTIRNGKVPEIRLKPVPKRLALLLQLSDAFLNDTTLSVPATPTLVPCNHMPGGLSACVISNDPLEWRGITSRLDNLDIVSSKHSQDPDFWLVCLSDHSDIMELTASLASETPVFLLKNTTLHHQPNWYPLKDPLNQRELVQAINQRSYPGRTIRVLVVDDDETNLGLHTLLLEELGYKVTASNNATEAISVVAKKTIDLVLMDVQMPGISGIKASRLMRKAGFAGPVIALSAHLSEAEKIEVREAGMNEAIIKPISKNSLKQLIEGYLLNLSSQPVVASAGVSGIFDERLALQRANQRQDLAAELLQLLIESLPQDQEKLNDAYANRDVDTFRRQVHKMHGALRYCGVPRLGGAIENLEDLVKQDNPLQSNETRVSLSDTNQEIDALCGWYRDTESHFHGPGRRENTKDPAPQPGWRANP